jgi:type II secretory pathway component GspD/PulD (secretin)
MKNTAIATFALVVSILLAPASSVATDQASLWDRAVKRARETPEAKRKRETRERILEKKLSDPVLVHFKSKPLREALAELGKLAGMKIVIDPKGLANVGISEDVPVTLDANSEIMVKSCLNLLLEKHHLAYYLEGDTVQVTSETLSLARFEVIDATGVPKEIIELLAETCRKRGDSAEERLLVCCVSGKVKFIVHTSDEAGEAIADVLKELFETTQKHELHAIQVGP